MSDPVVPYTVDELIERLNELRAVGFGDAEVSVDVRVSREGEFIVPWLERVEANRSAQGTALVTLVIKHEWWGE